MREEQYNKKGLAHGIWSFYDDNIDKVFQYYTEGKLIAEYTEAKWPNGQIKEVPSFKNGVPHGTWIGYWPDGSTRYTIDYKKGDKDGEELKSFEGKLIHAHSIYEGRSKTSLSTNKVNSICNGIELGSVTLDDPTLLNKCLDNNNASDWKNINANERAKILEKIADDIEEKPYELIYFLINEAGKTIQNAIDEIREGVDFLRYYSKEIIKLINNESQLDGPTGEENNISYTPKGRFLCISPWNFPVAILIGQISAALACVNKFIVKPSEHT